MRILTDFSQRLTECSNFSELPKTIRIVGMLQREDKSTDDISRHCR
ncbi:MAG: hypothetical protein IT524_09680 [Nitrosomonas sp.]|nr:hypothetical protein [Nitrosomonas sp.]